ncbi:MAG TPA: ADOP family duplicated permease [Acidobacteriaceae bacterium]
MSALPQDVRHALRQLRRAPGFAATAIVTLALGIGATTAMLAVVDSVLLRSVALPHAERLVTLSRLVKGEREVGFDYKDVPALAAVHSLEAVGSYGSLPSPVTTPDGTRVSYVMTTGPGFFRVPAVPARMGRVLTSEDGHRPVTVVSDAFWRKTLHSNPHVIGSAIKVGARMMTVVGVMPRGFAFPHSSEAEMLYVPETVSADGKDDHGFTSTLLVARLKPGVDPGAALSEAGAAYRQAGASSGLGSGSGSGTGSEDRGTLLMRSYRGVITGQERPALLALLGACALLLLIACANSANLQIARGATRLGEMSVRSALGAGRGRLLRQIVTESVTVSVLGAGLGLVLAWAALAWARSAYGGQFARFDELALHPLAYAGSTALAVLAGVVAALAPASSALRAAGQLQTAPARITRGSRLSGLLVAGEIALTCVLLTTAGLFLRTFRALEQLPLGFHPAHVTEITLMPLNPHEDTRAIAQTYDHVLERLAAMPGIEAAATQTSLPFSNFTLQMTNGFRIPGRPSQKGDEASVSLVSAGYTRTLGVPLLRGRDFTAADGEGAPAAALANETFVRRFIGARGAIGTTVEFTSDTKDGSDGRFLQVPVTIIGVVPDQAGSDLTAQADPLLLLNYRQYPPTGAHAHFMLGLAPQFAVRSSLSPDILDREIRSALKQAAPDMAEMRIEPIDEAIDATLSSRRLALRLAGSFGAIALVLAAVGIYGVLAYAVAGRTKEIGIRMALGSTRQGAMRLVLRHAALMVAAGLAAGIAGTWPAHTAVRAFLYGVRLVDPLTLSVVASVLLAVAALAAAVPAWRATHVDPMQALRSE